MQSLDKNESDKKLTKLLAAQPKSDTKLSITCELLYKVIDGLYHILDGFAFENYTWIACDAHKNLSHSYMENFNRLSNIYSLENTREKYTSLAMMLVGIVNENLLAIY